MDKVILRPFVNNQVSLTTENTMMTLLFYIMRYNGVRFETFMFVVSTKVTILRLNLTVD